MSLETTSQKKQIKLTYSDEEVLAFIAEFRRTFPDEEALARLINQLYNLGLYGACHACQSERIQLLKDGRLIKCQDCSTERWLTSGTFFHGAKKLFPWILDICLKTNGIFLSSSRFHKLVGVAQSTALIISKRISQVIASTYDEPNPEISTSLFLDLYSRRSSESVAQQHPRSEQFAIDKINEDNSDEDNFDDDPVETLNELQREVLEHLSSKPKNIDDLAEELPHFEFGKIAAALTILELSRLIKSEIGDYYVKVRKTTNTKCSFTALITDETEKSFDSIKYVIKTLFHGVSRKHIQYYIAKFWCLISRDKWKGHELLHACAAYHHITEREITTSITPLFMPMPKEILQLGEHAFI